LPIWKGFDKRAADDAQNNFSQELSDSEYKIAGVGVSPRGGERRFFDLGERRSGVHKCGDRERDGGGGGENRENR
jgi:hypothetical protein